MAWYPALIGQSGGVELVTWQDGTDEQIAAMLDAYYNDQLTWEDMGWTVGDTRVIHLDAMQAPNPNSSNTWAAQDITVVIVAHDHTDLAESINGHNKACITVQTKEAINSGYMYIDGNTGTNNISSTKWSNLYIRTYLNDKVLGAIPNTLSLIIKPSKHYKHDTYNGSTSEQVTDNIFLPSYPEVFGTAGNSYYAPTSDPSTEGTLFEYYETTANRIKYENNNGSSSGTAIFWWLSSPSTMTNVSGYYWYEVKANGTANYKAYNGQSYLAPAWVM